jgi:RND family efflux transporter MFP subunit
MRRAALLVVPLVVLAGATAVFARRSALPAAASPAKPLAVAAAGASRDGHVAAEGRVVAYPGAEVVVGSDFRGTVARLLVKEKDAVQKGQLLAEIDARPEKAELAEAEARIVEADADVTLFGYELQRAEQLLSTKVGSRQAVDKASRDLDAARARRATAAADADRLRATIAKSRIGAPIGGVVVAKHVEAGETIDRGARIATLVDLSRLRVEAEVDEADASRLAVGARVAIRAEGDTLPPLGGFIEEIPDAVTGRKTKPLDPGRPSDTRVLLVKIAFENVESGPTLKLGRRVEVEIDSTVR